VQGVGVSFKDWGAIGEEPRPAWLLLNRSGLMLLVALVLMLPCTTMCFQMMSYDYLRGDNKVYLQTILKKSVESTRIMLKSPTTQRLIEVEFPVNRKNDLSAAETLDQSRDFTLNFIEGFANEYKKSLWVCFPDRKEASLAKKKWGENLPFILTSIEGATMQVSTTLDRPKLIVAVTPGFNINEWIDLASFNDKVAKENCPIIIINGNLDRLRNGYYPSIFYPGLKKVTDSFYKQFEQALFLSPVAIAGNRFAAWLVKEYKEKDWNIVVKNSDNQYQSIDSYESPPDSSLVWRLAKVQITIYLLQIFSLTALHI